MGNYKFRLSNIMPNAWFHKLKQMSSTKNNNNNNNNKKFPNSTPKLQPNRSSCYITPRAEDLPRKSTKKVTRNPRKSSPEFPSFDPLVDSIPSWSTSSTCTLTTSATDIIIDIASKNPNKYDLDDMRTLPPIQTRPLRKCAEKPNFVEKRVDRFLKEQARKGNAKSSPTELHRLRIRANSPRISAHRASRKSNKSRGICDSFAVAKSSSDPLKDFRESMVEMIVENNIRDSRDLEELLACYLSLNSNEYHDVIVRAFQQIWFSLTRKSDCKM